MRNIDDFKLVEIGEVFACNSFMKYDNAIDILISCDYNFTDDELLDCDWYMSDGLPFISAYKDFNKDILLIQLCDCYNNMNYPFTDEELDDIKNKATAYIDSIKNGEYGF